MITDGKSYETMCLNRWNLDTINEPTLIVRPKCKNDIRKTINFVRENKLNFVVKSSGHNIISSIKGGVSLDVSLMKLIVVNEKDQTVKVEPGCTFHDIDEITSQYGLVTPLCQVGTISIGGFSLGGGLGYLTKEHGLSCDNLVECVIITGDGIKRVCNQHKNKDLFWAVRGAGGFVGVVVSFTFKCYPIKNIMVGTFIYTIDSTLNVKNALIKTGIGHSNKSDPLVYVVNLIPNLNNPNEPDKLLVKLIYLDSKSFDIGTLLMNEFKNKTNITSSSISIRTYNSIQCDFDNILPGKYYSEGPMLKSTITPEVADLLLESMKNRNKYTDSQIILTETVVL